MLSVITASYNSEKTISLTIESLLNQSSKNFEYIIVDGGSGDNTVKIIQSYEKSFKEKGVKYFWVSESDKGIYDAWNKGVKLASGDWISFLGSDDVYNRNSLEIYESVINSIDSDSYDLIYSNVEVVQKEKHLKTIKGIWSWTVFKRYMNIAHVGAFHNIQYFSKYGFFDDNYKICGDYELLLRAKENLKSKKFNKVTARMSYGGISNSQIEKVLKETLIVKMKTGEITPIICYYDYLIAFIKYYLRKTVYAFFR